jgi:carboxypeptidase C (cathepsin A)
MYAGAQPKVIPKASSSSQIVVDGVSISIPYQVSWVPIVLSNAAGTPQATISATSYVRSDTAAQSNRPVLFAWHGGPGAAGIGLGFDLLGPRRSARSGETDIRNLTDGPDTLLEVAGIVLIDPVATGLSYGIPQLILELGHTITQDDQSRQRLQRELHRFLRQAIGK